ncbi:MAG: capsule biosynthesis protein CapK [Rhodoferax ferrireducens]|uniref:Capsule biosynthesis protein CapK n=2 Tax=Pseudomonadota TaxID=1224 RepID=A0A1Y1QZN0_9GAMM|nr:MAG: capsule biosynthesis protein CapK [Rhodoferax ferrireducens]OQX17329.1 MAG: capsule biosynthesis protein CapK [Thiothrix lacustris]
MTLRTRLISHLIFPLQERLKHHTTARLLQEMEASQYWPKDQLDDQRLSRLRELFGHANQHVPYYRELFSRVGFDPRAITSVDDLQRLPLLTKSEVRAHTDAMKSDLAQGLTRFNTGGSSGEPLVFFIGRERVSHDVAAKWRATRWWGVDIGDPEIVLWGSPIELNSQDRIRQWRDALMRTQLLPAFEMSPEKVRHFIAVIRKTRPAMLFGYPSAFAHIAQFAQSQGTRLDDLGVKVAFVTSERLYDHQRELIERTFNCPVANGYGGRDAGFIAHQCPAGGMHLTYEDVIVEIVDAQGLLLPPGQSGEIVVTHLATQDFPFIRYRTGDIGTLDTQPCTCGRTLPLLKDIQGRTTDFLVASNGTVMHGLSLVYIVRDLPGVQQFKIVQESLELTRILIVTGDCFDSASIQGIEQGAKARLGQNVRVSVELVTSIEPEKSGKYRYVVSHVAS